MIVTVLFFAMLREAAGVDRCRLALPPGADGHAVRQALDARYPGLAPWWSCVRFARNCAYEPWETMLTDGDEVSVLPPVSGG